MSQSTRPPREDDLPDLAGPLGPEPPGDSVVGKAGDLCVTLLHDRHREHGQVSVHDAAAHGLPLSLALVIEGSDCAGRKEKEDCMYGTEEDQIWNRRGSKI